jgi:hypothetical protein
VAAPPAASADPVPLPEDVWVLPSSGSQHPASSWPNATNFEMFDFTIYADGFHAGVFHIEVATSPDAEPGDGTLVDVIDTYDAPVDPRTPAGEVFTARANPASEWLARLGTYYWQAYYTAADGTVYATPIETITIVERPPPDPPSDPPPPLPSPPASTSAGSPAPIPAKTAARLTRTVARAIIQRAIRSRTHRSAQKLATSCSLPSATSARCNVSWHDARYRYRGNAKLKSTTAGILVTLDGTRTQRTCSTRTCSRAIHWSVATA